MSGELSLDDNYSRHSRSRGLLDTEFGAAEDAAAAAAATNNTDDASSIEVSLAERSHRSKRSLAASLAAKQSLDDCEASVEVVSLAEGSYRNHGIPELLTLEYASSPKVPEVLSLPDRKLHHHHKHQQRHSGDYSNGSTSREAALSLPDHLLLSSSKHSRGTTGFSGGLALNHPSSHRRNHSNQTDLPSRNNGDPIRNIHVRDKLFPTPPAALLKPTSSCDESTLGGFGEDLYHEDHPLEQKQQQKQDELVRPASSSRSLGFSQSSYFYGNGVIVSGGPPNEIFTDEFGNKCAQYVNRTVIINDHQASYAASRTQKSSFSSGSDNNSSTSSSSRGKSWSSSSSFFRGDSFRYKAVLFFFMASTLFLLLLLVMGYGAEGDSSSSTNNLRPSIPVAGEEGYYTPPGDDLFADDDDDDDYAAIRIEDVDEKEEEFPHTSSSSSVERKRGATIGT